MDKAGELTTTPRDPRVKITERPCSVCRGNTPVGLVIGLRGLVQAQALVCKACFYRCAEIIGAGKADAVLLLTFDAGNGQRIIHG